MKSSLIIASVFAVLSAPAFAGSANWTYIPSLTFPTETAAPETTKSCVNPAVLTDTSCLSDAK